MDLSLRVTVEEKWGDVRAVLSLGDVYITSFVINPSYRPEVPREQVAVEAFASRLRDLLDDSE